MPKCGTASHGAGDCGERAWGNYLGRNSNHRAGAGTSVRSDCFALGFAGQPQRPGKSPPRSVRVDLSFWKSKWMLPCFHVPFNGKTLAAGRRARATPGPRISAQSRHPSGRGKLLQHIVARGDLIIGRALRLVSGPENGRRDQARIRFLMNTPVPRVRNRHRGQEGLGVGMARIFQDSGAGTELDNSTQIHHSYMM